MVYRGKVRLPYNKQISYEKSDYNNGIESENLELENSNWAKIVIEMICSKKKED